MTYHGVAFECDHCGKIIFDWDDEWQLKYYDKHYCPDCKEYYEKVKYQ